jgi:hypothetical protein
MNLAIFNEFVPFIHLFDDHFETISFSHIFVEIDLPGKDSSKGDGQWVLFSSGIHRLKGRSESPLPPSQDEFPAELWRDFGKLGYLGLRYPEEIGGMNIDPVTAMIFYEEVTRGSVGFAQGIIQNILMGTYFLYRFGSEEIKKRCLFPEHVFLETASSIFAGVEEGLFSIVDQSIFKTSP